MQTGKTLFSLVVVALMAACSPEDNSVCLEAAEHFKSCTGESAAKLIDACDPGDAQEILAADCDSLADFVAMGGKADGSLEWKDYGERCWFNFQCSGSLVCIPLEHLAPSDQLCLEKRDRNERRYCDSDSDCADGLICLGEDIFANGLCEDEA